MIIGECKSYSKDDIEVNTVYDENGNPDRDLNEGDYVRHFKGNIYRILGTALHSEDKSSLIIYESVTATEKTVYARPYDMFLSEVDHDKYPDVTQKWRFEKVNVTERRPTKKNVILQLAFGRQSEGLCGNTISEFFNTHYNPDIHAIRAWNTNNKDDIYIETPSGKTYDIAGQYSGAKLVPTNNIKDGISIVFHIGTMLKSTILYGDDIYIIDEGGLLL